MKWWEQLEQDILNIGQRILEIEDELKRTDDPVARATLYVAVAKERANRLNAVMRRQGAFENNREAKAAEADKPAPAATTPGKKKGWSSITPREAEDMAGHACPECGKGKMVQKTGPKGKFLGCDTYPACKNAYNIK